LTSRLELLEGAAARQEQVVMQVSTAYYVSDPTMPCCSWCVPHYLCA
jgi:hypothetical protein